MHRSHPGIALTLLLTACTPQATQPNVPASEATLQRLIGQRLASPLVRGSEEAEAQPFTTEEAEGIFRLLDSNGDGTIQATEWSARVPEASPAMLDANSDDQITHEEFRTFVLTLPEELQPDSRGEALASMPELSDSTFSERVLDADRLAVVMFTAPWNGPSRFFKPIVAQAFEKYDLAGGAINTDLYQRVGIQFNVRWVPTVLFFKNGQELAKERIVSPMPLRNLQRRVESVLEAYP